MAADSDAGIESDQGVSGGPISFVAPVMIESPCVNICTLDAARAHCTGCGRTVAEIAGWTRGTPDWRRAVIAELPERLARATR